MSLESECSSWFSSFGFLSLASPGTAHSCGSVLLYRLRYVLCGSFLHSAGHFIRADFFLNNVRFHVVCVYAPNRNLAWEDFFQFVLEHVDPGSPTVICGDFNTVFDRSRDRCGFAPALLPHDSPGALASLFTGCCVVDVWRHFYLSTTTFTWLRLDGSFLSQIDLVGCPIPWLHQVRACYILPCPYSDHSSVLLVYPIPVPQPRGPGWWIFNTSLLKDPDFLQAVTAFWSSWTLRKPSSSLQSWWDGGKKRLKGLAICFSTARQA